MLPIRLYRVCLTQCSCVDAFVVNLIIPGCAFYGSTYFRMSTRRLPVILFVSHFEWPLYPVVYCMVCAYGGRGGLLFHCARRRVNILRLFQSLLLIILLPPPPSAIRQPYRSRLYNGCYVNCFYYDISYLYYMSVCCPSSAGYQSGLYKSRDVHECQPGVTTGESRMFQALVVLDQYPAGLSASLHRLGFM